MRFQQNLVSSSPAFRMPETYRKIGESTFAIHPQVGNCSFVYLENFPLYSQSYLQPMPLRFLTPITTPPDMCFPSSTSAGFLQPVLVDAIHY